MDKEEVNKTLPLLDHQIVRFDIAKKLVQQQHPYCIEALQNSDVAVSFEVMAMQRELALKKLPLCIEYINELLETEDRVLIFCWHKDIIDILETSLDTQNTPVMKLDGRSPKSIIPLIEKWFNQAERRKKILICQIKAGGEGLDFSSTRHVVFVEFYWNPGSLEQSYSRALKHGNTHPITIHYLVANNSLDDVMLRNVMKKQRIVNQFNTYMKGDDVS